MYNFIQIASAASRTKKKTSEARMVLHLVEWGKVNDLKILNEAPAWQIAELKKSEKEVLHFQSKIGPVWILRPKLKNFGFEGAFEENLFAWIRDTVGTLWATIKNQPHNYLRVDLGECGEEVFEAAVIGFGLSHYQFKEKFEEKKIECPTVLVSARDLRNPKASLQKAIDKVYSLNFTRHLINLPPNICNPVSVGEMLEEELPAGLKITVWDEKRMVREKMNLLLAVGQGSANPPRLVHMQWRPVKGGKAPVCFVGKGVTFDTGGLDIKPSSGMRLMKKDMGGAAVVAGLALWVAKAKIPVNCDFFLALAENAVDGKSFRPSDLIKSRGGFLVEIDNTDAEGRLVLADALSVALDEKPAAVIDVATLTGAIKVALGAEVAGLFSNQDDLARELENSARRKGEGVWRMPLVQKYFSGLSGTPFADFKNAADGFGGAITAALFLQKYVNGTPWAHLDIYAWADRAQGAVASSGGHAQTLQTLMDFIENRA
ncbi:MAG: leucyl aminopeptidase family protein [Bdellovibrionota bacterium]